MARYTINEDDKTAMLEIKVAGIFETAYNYSNGMVTLSERVNTATLTADNLSNNLTEIGTWINDISTKLSPGNQSRESFNQKLDKDAERVAADFSNKEIKVTDANYKFEDKVFKFKPRSEVTMNFQCFKNWYLFLRAFYDAIL